MAITIKNIDRLVDKLNNLADVDVEKYVRKATTFVHAQAKLLAPVDNGHLKGSIHMKVDKEKNKVTGRVYTNVNYAPFVEFGTGIRGNGSYPYANELDFPLVYKDKPWRVAFESTKGDTKGKKIVVYTKGQKAQPFMYPALKGAEKYVERLIQNGVQSEIDKIAGGGK